MRAMYEEWCRGWCGTYIGGSVGAKRQAGRECSGCGFSFFFNDTATTEIYTLSLHDALPISQREMGSIKSVGAAAARIGMYKKRGRCRNKKWAG